MRRTRAQIKKRILAEAWYMIETHSTLRETAKVFAVSHSTVYRDVTYELKFYSISLYTKVRVILNENGAESAMRGGLATRQKYLKLKEGA